MVDNHQGARAKPEGEGVVIDHKSHGYHAVTQHFDHEGFLLLVELVQSLLFLPLGVHIPLKIWWPRITLS